MTALEWVDWYDNDRLHSHCGDIPPIEYETLFYADTQTESATAGPAQPALH